MEEHKDVRRIVRKIVYLNPGDVTAVSGQESKRVKLAMLSVWAGHAFSHLSITATLADSGHR